MSDEELVALGQRAVRGYLDFDAARTWFAERAAARRAPTDAMIDAAFNVAPEVSRAAVVEMLRAALAASTGAP